MDNTVTIDGITYEWVIEFDDIILQTPSQDLKIEGGWYRLRRETEEYISGVHGISASESEIDEHSYRELPEFVKRHFDRAKVSWSEQGKDLLESFGGLSFSLN